MISSSLPKLDTATEIESDVLTIPETQDPTNSGDGFRVIIYNDDHTPIDAVIEQLIKATQCSEPKAVQITLEAHHKGRAVCYRGAKEKCHQVARVLREIRLQCEVDSD
jgi:ATP-dependent Clp protease adapter protein ClpS